MLTYVLDRYLRLLHPVMPHLTEEIWGRLPHRPDDPDLLIVARWPDVAHPAAFDARQAEAVGDILELVTQIRNARADAGHRPRRRGSRPTCRSRTRPRGGVRARSATRSRGWRGSVPRSVDVGARTRRGAETADDALRRRRPRAARPAFASRPRTSSATDSGSPASWRTSSGSSRRRSAKLADEGFTRNAPPAVVDGVRARERELQERAARLRELGAG